VIDRCQCYVDRSKRDYDSHGSFWQSWQEPCTEPAHRNGRCREHHAHHLLSLRTSIEFHQCQIAVKQRELLALTDELCSGHGKERC
jgi:hypothetical protein